MRGPSRRPQIQSQVDLGVSAGGLGWGQGGLAHDWQHAQRGILLPLSRAAATRRAVPGTRSRPHVHQQGLPPGKHMPAAVHLLQGSQLAPPLRRHAAPQQAVLPDADAAQLVLLRGRLGRRVALSGDVSGSRPNAGALACMLLQCKACMLRSTKACSTEACSTGSGAGYCGSSLGREPSLSLGSAAWWSRTCRGSRSSARPSARSSAGSMSVPARKALSTASTDGVLMPRCLITPLE